MTKLRKLSTRFDHAPEAPTADETRSAHAVLCYAHESASSFLSVFEAIRTTRKAKGTSTDEEQDLLRAMLVFASSGLDSMVKQLITDALPLVIERDKGARALYVEFVEKRVVRQDRLDAKFLTSVLTSRDPHDVMLAALIAELTSGSLQSAEAILKTAAHFNIPSKELTTDPDKLKRVFTERNQISHEMDIDFEHPTRNRFSRRKREMIAHTNELFRVSRAFLNCVDIRLKPDAA